MPPISSAVPPGAIPRPEGTAFRVWAPHAGGVSVRGSWDEWSTARPMAAEDDGYWFVQLADARPGDEYKYVITTTDDEALWKVDPRARRLTSSVGNSVIEPEDFDWGGQQWHSPGWDELVIYELHVGTFNRASPDGPPGRFSGVIERLDELADLGVTAIELLPVTEYAGESSSGYNPVSAFAVAADYGSPGELKTLVKEAHGRGLAVLCDVVYNHFGPGDLNDGLRRYDGWYEHDGDGIYFYNDGRRQTPWGPRPDYGRPEVRRYLRDSALSWLEDYRMDGLRWDGTAFIRKVNGGGGGWGDGDIPDGWGLMCWINDEIKARQPWKISIAEDLQGDSAITGATPGGAGFASQWDAGFVHTLRAALTALDDRDRSIAQVGEAIRHRIGARALNRVIYAECHDTVGDDARRLPEAISPGDAGSWYARKRTTLGAAALLTAPGIPMLYQGQEFLEDGVLGDRIPLDWRKRKRHPGVVKVYKDLIGLRRNLEGTTAGLRGDHVEVFHANDVDKVVAYYRHASESGGPRDSTIVVLNFANAPRNDYRIGLPREGTWHVRFNSDAKVYDPRFLNTSRPAYDAAPAPYDGLPCTATIEVGPYSAIILSQGD